MDSVTSALSRGAECGRLLDISPLARRAGLPYPTFITAAFWNSVELDRQDCRVLLAAEGVGRELARDPAKFRRGSFEICFTPDLLARGWPRAACPWLLHLRVTVLPSHGDDKVLVLSDPEETIDFRANGLFYLM